MKKAIVLVAFLCTILLVYNTALAIVYVDSWGALQDALKGDNDIVLTADIKAGDSDTTLIVGDGTIITLDLNGHTIDRNLASPKGSGSVFTVRGNLTINDSVGTGLITGGNDSSYAGGFHIHVKGKLVLNGGTIKGNNGNYAGGVFLSMFSSFMVEFEMNGGSIVDNTSTSTSGYLGGSAVYIGTGKKFTLNDGIIENNFISNYGSFTMNGGSITDNPNNAGVYNRAGGKFFMLGGSINNNYTTGSEYGPGVANSGVFEFNGGTIKNNYYSGAGSHRPAGIFNWKGASLSMNGKGVISDNSGFDISLNIDNDPIFITDKLNSDTLYVNTWNSPTASKPIILTSGLWGNGTPDSFKNTEYVIAWSNNEAALGTASYMVTYQTEDNTVLHSQSVISGGITTYPESIIDGLSMFEGWYLGDSLFDFTTPIMEETVLTAKGHDWNEPTYTWADDNTTVTATRICKHDDSHIETETASVTSAVTKAATCEELGETTYSASFTNEAFAPQSKTLADIPAIGHDWGEPAYTWAEDNKSVTASRVCSHDGSHVETETATVTTTVTKPATCEVAGETTYSASFTNEAFAAQSKTLADIPATGHDWGEVTYTWADDNKSVTASRVCSHDGSHVETETANVTATVTKPATCEVAGETTYSAAFTNTAFAAQSKTLADIPATGHDWGEVSYTWAEDNQSVTASRICKHDASHTEAETATVTAMVSKPATCEVAGETTYSASFTNEAFKQQSKALADIPATGHDWGEVTYTWAEDNKSVTASRVCSHDATHAETETATVTSTVTKAATCEVAGETTYSVAFNNAAFAAQSKTLADIPATGHDWGDVTYTWADDNRTVTASRVCKNDETHTETETAIVTAEVTKPATCEAAGETTYSAAFANAAFAPQSKALADIPATGHDWGEVTYTWADDNKSVTASRVCKHDGSHIETETANVTATISKPATCEVAGETTYSAAFTSTAFAAQSKALTDIPATGHDWGEVTYTWADDNKSVTASRACSHDGSHIETETATVTTAVTKPATCEEAGETTYSAAFTNTAFEAQSKTLADIPALGHTPVFTPGKLPTANTPGHTAGSTCSVCGKALADHRLVESVQTLTLPAALRTVADSAFARTAADHVLLPAGTTAIGSRAFADAPNLRFVTVPDSVNSIAPDAFEGCQLLTFFCSDTSAAAEFAESHGFAHTSH